jgi:TolB-like protein/DNA-binding winged helix-turn-helix (wHTH) protein/Tfp pilus assembly protein PilF
VQGDLRIGHWLVEPQANTIRAGQNSVRLEPKVMQVLLHLARHPGQVVSKEKLLLSVWAGTFVTDDVLTRSISTLRKVFQDDARNPRVIQTIPKSGYRLIAPVEWLSSDEPSPDSQSISGSKELDTDETPSSARAPALVLTASQPFGWANLTRRGTVAFIAVLAIAIGALMWHRRRSYGPRVDSLAVLPFTNLGSDPGADYFSDGLALGVINSLARAPNLKVISQASTLHFKGQKLDPQEVGRKLRVTHLLLGRFREHDGSLMVSVELVDTRDSHHLWGEEYTSRTGDILSVQRDISRDAAEAMGIELAASGHQGSRRSTENREAYQLYLMGRYFWNKRSESGLKKSIDYLQQAIAKDPSFALAYAGLADSYDLLSEYGIESPQESFPKAVAAARKALELDDSLAEAHSALALAKAYHDWDWTGAEREFRRALELDPGYATGHQWYANYLKTTGRMEQALTEARRAQELDPLSLIINLNVAELLIHNHRFDEATLQIRKVLELDPSFADAHICMALWFMEKNMIPEALEEEEKAVVLSERSPDALLSLAYTYAIAGDRNRALRIVAAVRGQTSGRYISPVGVAAVYARAGDKGWALDLLERAYQEHDDEIADLGVNTEFDSLRSEPRFQSLVRRLRPPEPGHSSL